VKQKTAGRPVRPSTAVYFVGISDFGGLVHPFEISKFVFDTEFQLFEGVEGGLVRMRAPFLVGDLCVQIGML
jgi:hypothetical protein